MMGSLVPKEGDRQRVKTGMEEDVKYLEKELKSIHIVLRDLGEVPPEQLDPPDKCWAGDLRELSCDIEDVLFLVSSDSFQPANPDGCFIGLISKIINKHNVSHPIVADAIKGIKNRIVKDAEQYEKARARVTDRLSIPVDAFRQFALHQSEGEFVGVEEAVQDLICRLIGGDGVAEQQLKVVSVVGFGGLGKTAVANLVYKNKSLRSQFDCCALVSLSRDPNMETILSDLLLQLQKGNISQPPRDLTRLTDELKLILDKKRYFIVVDDIWDKKSWVAIKRAMAENDLGSRIITTTRNIELAEEIGCVYKLKPLSPVHSKRLFYRRIFDGDENPSDLFAEISDKILKKCDGLPLAIISIAGMLSIERSKEPNSAWLGMYNSIGSGRDMWLEMETMRRVLLFSYYDVPFHVRNCLLCISVFPEDYKIRRDRLVRIWIAEGFVKGRQGSNLLEIGQSYFRELLNRGMIEEVDINDGSDGTVKYCRVHHIMLDLIRFLSREENFVTVLGDGRVSPLQGKVRRLSLQTSEVDDRIAVMCMCEVRSVTAFGPGINQIQVPPLWRFELLRVMDLEGCYHMKRSYGLKHIGKLLHLRYLGLRDTLIAELPEDIGSLRFLQILDIVGSDIKELPPTVALLQQLICLNVDHKTRLPDRIGSLTSLLELSNVSITESPNFVTEMHKLTELTAIGIVWNEMKEPSLEKELLETIGKLNKLQTLNVYGCSESALEHMRESGWVPPSDLRTFNARDAWFSQLPSWISTSTGSSSSMKLTELQIGVRELRHEDLQALGRLKELRTLQLAVERTGGLLVVGAGAFPRLRELRLRGETCHYQLVFQQGAAPKVQVVELHVSVERAKDDDGLVRGLENHPNRPTLHIVSLSSDQEKDKEEERGQISNVTLEIEESSTSTSMRNTSQY